MTVSKQKDIIVSIDSNSIIEFDYLKINLVNNNYYVNDISLFENKDKGLKIFCDTSKRKFVTGNNMFLMLDTLINSNVVIYKYVNLGIDDETNILVDKLIFDRKKRTILFKSILGDGIFKINVRKQRIEHIKWID